MPEPRNGPRIVPGAADDRHQRRFDRHRERGRRRVDEAIEVDVEHARDAGDQARQHERHVEMLADIVAHAAHARLARLDAAQRQAEGRRHQHPIGGGDDQHDGKHDVVVAGRVRDSQAPDRGKRNTGHAVVAAGERGPAIGDAPDDVAERERDQDEVDAARAHRGGENEGEQRYRPGCRAGAAASGAEAMAHLQDRDRVGRDREEGRMAEREQAGMAEQQVGRKRQQAEDHDLHQQRDPELAGEERHANAAAMNAIRSDGSGAIAQCSLPKIPVARNRSRIAIGPNRTK